MRSPDAKPYEAPHSEGGNATQNIGAYRYPRARCAVGALVWWRTFPARCGGCKRLEHGRDGTKSFTGADDDRLNLRLEPLGLERIATALRLAGHDVRLTDLQVFTHKQLWRDIDEFRPQAVGFSLNYLANIPEVLDLAREIRQRLGERCFIFAGGHSVSFVADEVLRDVVRGLSAAHRGSAQ